jgi:ATP-binding cassette subfamily A (ABC1) protein 3
VDLCRVGADESSKISNRNDNENDDRVDTVVDIEGDTSHVTVTLDLTTPNKLKLNYLTGALLTRNQCVAMFLKKFLYAFRSWYLILIQTGPLMILLIATVLGNRGFDTKITFPALNITLDSYQNPITVISGRRNEYYAKYLQELNEYQVDEASNITAKILNLTSEHSSLVNKHYIVGASFEKNSTTAWFNGNPYHSPPLALSLVLNVYYKMHFGSERSISFINRPLPFNFNSEVENLPSTMMGFPLGIELGYGMTFVASFFILFYIRERVSKFKHLQFVSGVNATIFWGISFLSDLITYAVIAAAILITMAALQEDSYKTPGELGRLALVLTYFGFFVLPFLYLFSYLMVIPSTGFSRTMLLGSVTGILGLTAIRILEIGSLNLLYIAKPLHWILLFMPFYSVISGIYDLTLVHYYRQICLDQGSPEEACEVFSRTRRLLFNGIAWDWS